MDLIQKLDIRLDAATSLHKRAAAAFHSGGKNEAERDKLYADLAEARLSVVNISAAFYAAKMYPPLA